MTRVKYKKPRAKKVRAPKPVPPPKPSRPKRSELRTYYKDLLSADRDTRIDALAKGMAWYDRLLAYSIYKQEGKWRTNQLREKSAAERDRGVGIASNDSKKKEIEFLSSIQHYEKIVPDFKPPLLKKVLTKFNKDKPKLEARKKKLANKFGEFLDLIKEMLKPFNSDEKQIDLYVDKLKAEYRISSEGNLTLDRTLVGNVRTLSRKCGVFPAIIQLLPFLSEAAARMPELDAQHHKTGRTVISNSKRYRSVLVMLNNLLNYYQKTETSKKLIRRVKKEKINEC